MEGVFNFSLVFTIVSGVLFFYLFLSREYSSSEWSLRDEAHLPMIGSYVLMISSILLMGQPPDYLSIWNWTMPIVAMASIPIAGYFTHYVVAEE